MRKRSRPEKWEEYGDKERERNKVYLKKEREQDDNERRQVRATLDAKLQKEQKGKKRRRRREKRLKDTSQKVEN